MIGALVELEPKLPGKFCTAIDTVFRVNDDKKKKLHSTGKIELGVHFLFISYFFANFSSCGHPLPFLKIFLDSVMFLPTVMSNARTLRKNLYLDLMANLSQLVCDDEEVKEELFQGPKKRKRNPPPVYSDVCCWTRLLADERLNDPESKQAIQKTLPYPSFSN